MFPVSCKVHQKNNGTAGLELNAVKECGWDKVFHDLVNRSWYSGQGKKYKVFARDAESWTCLSQDGETQKMYTIWYDAAANSLWWGNKWKYFSDLSDLTKEPHKLSWYNAHDMWKRKPVFVWQSWAEESEESTDDSGDNASTKESIYDSADNASTKESGETSSIGGSDATAEELIKIIGPPPGLEEMVQDTGDSKLGSIFLAADNECNLYGSGESTTDSSGSGDEIRPRSDFKKLINLTPLPHAETAEDAEPKKIILRGADDPPPMPEELGAAATEDAVWMVHSSGQRFTRAHHRPRVKKGMSDADRPFAPLTRSTRPKANAVPQETGSRTQLRSSAKMFQPLPFMPMSSVQAAWNQWEEKASVRMPCNGSWQQR